MVSISRQTLRNGAIGGLVGSALGAVPLILLVAPILGGGIAGYLERDGPKRGAVAGAVAGVVMAAVSTLITSVLLFVRFNELPSVTQGPLTGLGIAALLSVAAALSQVIVAGIGGGLGAILAADRQARTRETATRSTLMEGSHSDGRGRRWGAIAASFVGGFVTFLVVGLAVSIVLEPFIWLSVFVGIPIGFLAGAAVAVLGYRYLTRSPEQSMNWRAVGAGLAAVLVVFALVLGGLSVLGDQRIDRTTESTYEYRVTASTDETLDNVTIYVPLPVDNGESVLGEQFVQSVQYSRYTPGIVGYEQEPVPVNFTYDLVDTEHGPMLAITTDRIEVSKVYYREVTNETMGWRERIPAAEYDPTNSSMGVRDDGKFQFTVTLVSDGPIETADPVGREPLLTPEDNRTQVDCVIHPSERQRCYEYDSWVYATYDTDANTTVSIGVELAGRNEWFSGGWNGNEYRQRASLQLRGPGTGWYQIDGNLEVGVGTYRD